MITVHRIIAANDRGEGCALRQGENKAGERFIRHLGQGIAAIGKGMQRNPDAAPGQRLGYCHDMLITAVDTAIRHQPHQMRRTAGFKQAFSKGLQPGQGLYRLILNGCINPGQILQNNAPGTDGHVANLGIADLTFGQTHGRA